LKRAGENRHPTQSRVVGVTGSKTSVTVSRCIAVISFGNRYVKKCWSRSEVPMIAWCFAFDFHQIPSPRYCVDSSAWKQNFSDCYSRLTTVWVALHRSETAEVVPVRVQKHCHCVWMSITSTVKISGLEFVATSSPQ
jgi:hypothetical protein